MFGRNVKMNKWQDILKVQVLDTTTSLSSINEPMIEDKDCCQEAKEEYIDTFANVKFDFYTREFVKVSPDALTERDILEAKQFTEGVHDYECDAFKHIMKTDLSVLQGSTHPQMVEEVRIVKEILANWEECENE